LPEVADVCQNASVSDTDTAHPFAGLVEGRLRTYFDRAYEQRESGAIRGAYDYAMMALNAALFELAPGADALFPKLTNLIEGGKIDASVLEQAKGLPFVCKLDAGITDMDLTYMSEADLQDFLEFLEATFRSLRAKGVLLAADPRGQ